MKVKFLGYSIVLVFLFAIANTGFAHTEFSSENITPTIPTVELTTVDIYPNPATDHIYLKFQNPIANDVTIEVRSFIGNQMETSMLIQQSNLIKVAIENLPAGHYYAIISYDGEKVLKKFIKKA